MSYIHRLVVTSLIVIVSVHSQKLQEQRIQSYQTCQTDRDCKENSFCYGNDDDKTGKCKCLNGFELIRNSTFYECLAAVALGDACERHVQCQILSSKLAICNKYKICACNSESHPKDGVCHATVKLGEVCMTDANCLLNNEQFAYCTDGRCSCRADEVPSMDKRSCILSRTLGQPCSADAECSGVDNTVCLDKCRCATGYTLSRDETSCVKAATNFLDPCDYDGQCSALLEQSICSNGRCTCSSGYHDYGNRCVLTKRLGERCEEVAQCVFEKQLKENVDCAKGICTCVFGTRTDGFCNIEKVPDDNSSISHVVSFCSIFVILVTVFI